METNRRDIIMSFAIKEIYVEYQKAPIGLDEKRPRFSWIDLYGLSLDYIIYGNPEGKKEEIPDKGKAVMNILKELEPEEYECCLDMMLIYARRAGKSREKNTIGEESKQNPA